MQNIASRNGISSGMAYQGQLWAYVFTRNFGIAIAALSLTFILIYVFAFTDYNAYLYSDMQAYWGRAMDRLNGRTFIETQFLAWPPGYHIFLAELFRILQWIGLPGLVRLETALTLNIVVYTGSVYALHRIAVRWFTRPALILTVMLLYGFGFPAWYFNAFLLAGNLALPLFLIAGALVYCRSNWYPLVAAAVLFAFATAVRPSIGPFGLAFVIYFFVRSGLNWVFITRAAVFSTVYFALIFAASAEVSRISHGKVTGLSANGGLDFFIANSRYHRVDLNYAGWHNFVVVPALSMKPENGFYSTQVPYYHQDFYYKLGWGFIKHDPLRIIKNFEHIKDLFYSRMLPSKETPGYLFFRPAWDTLKLIMFLSLGLYLWMWRALKVEERPLFGFLTGVIAVTLLVSYLFTGEPRYTFSIIFVFYLLFFKLVETFCDDWTRWKKVWLPFGLTLGLGAGVVLVVMAAIKPGYPPTVTVQTQPLNDVSATEQTKVSSIGRIYFPVTGVSGKTDEAWLVSADDGVLVKTGSKISMRTNMEIERTGPLSMKFNIYSTWPFELKLDGKTLIAQGDDLSYFRELNAFANPGPGLHTIEVFFKYFPYAGGFTVTYNFFDSDKWEHRNMLGVSDTYVHFMLPDSENGRE